MARFVRYKIQRYWRIGFVTRLAQIKVEARIALVPDTQRHRSTRNAFNVLRRVVLCLDHESHGMRGNMRFGLLLQEEAFLT
jgi:hypothetical protein